MSEVRWIACVGDDAYDSRIYVDLECHPRDKHIIKVRDHNQRQYLHGRRPESTVFVRMGWIDPETLDIIRYSRFKEITIEEAQELIKHWRTEKEVQ